MKLDKVERIIIVIRVINFAISCSSRYINIYIYTFKCYNRAFQHELFVKWYTNYDNTLLLNNKL